jgi:hypothetical protein
MTQLPDVSCLIKVLNEDGKRANDWWILGYRATVRYVFFNDSNMTAGPLNIQGDLFRDGVRVQPNGDSNVVPKQAITLQPGEIRTFEFEVIEDDNNHVYTAFSRADFGAFNISVVDEEDESNNKAKTFFLFQPHSQ